MTVKQIQEALLTSPEFRIELTIQNNPEGVAEAMQQAGLIPEKSEYSLDEIRERINALLLQNRGMELEQLLAVVPLIPERLSPNAITAINTLPGVKSADMGPLMENGQFVSNQGGGFDWGNMQFWGQVHETLGGLFGLANGQQADPGTVTVDTNATQPPSFTEKMAANWQTIALVLAIAAVAYLIYQNRKK